MSKYLNKRDNIAGRENLTEFTTFSNIDRYADGFLTGYSLVFMTKPELFISPYSNPQDIEQMAYNNMRKDPVFTPYMDQEATKNSNDLLIAEQLSYYGRGLNFLPLFTNRARSLSLSDTVLGSTSSFNTRHGYSMNIPTHLVQSLAAGELTISVTETDNLDFLKMITLWTKYISNISDGTFDANPAMIRDGVIDYMSSIYYLVLDPDGHTIRHWTKFTGVYPTSVPNSSMSYNRGDMSLIEHGLTFSYAIREEMDPSILEDFNRVSLKIPENAIVDENEDNFIVQNNSLFSKSFLRNFYLGNTPYILYDKESENRQAKFKLVFPENIKRLDPMIEVTGEDYLFNRDSFFDEKDYDD